MNVEEVREGIAAIARKSYNQGRIDSLRTLKEALGSVLDTVGLPDDAEFGIKITLACADESIAAYEAEQE